MARLQSFDLTIQTGDQGLDGPPKYSINGFQLDFDESQGGCGPGETFHGVGNPDSFPHTLLLHGPKEGVWRIEGVTVTYRLLGEEPYTLRFGPVELDGSSDLNLKHERALPTIDV